MVTKNEAENIMEEAIGSQITDYLIKPVNPNQVLLSLKKIMDTKRLVSEKTTTAYQQDFRNLFMALSSNPNHEEWKELYKKLVYWELEMARSDSSEMMEVLQSKSGSQYRVLQIHIKELCQMDKGKSRRCPLILARDDSKERWLLTWSRASRPFW